MGNEVAVIQAQQTSPAQPFGQGAEGFETAQRIAKALAASTLVPEAYRGNVPNVLVAMELANRIGASTFAVMQNMDVIHGRPGLRSQFLIATVNASGRFTPLRYRFTGQKGTDSWGCIAFATDIASSEVCEGTEITIEIAKAEGWYGRNGSKWKSIPQQMLIYRAAAFWQRVYCPEFSLGMRTAEENEDMPAMRAERAQAAAAALDAPDEIPVGEFTVQAPAAAQQPPAPIAEREPGSDDGEGGLPPLPGSQDPDDLFEAQQAELQRKADAKRAAAK